MEGFVFQNFCEASGDDVEDGEYKLWGAYTKKDAGEMNAKELLDMRVQDAVDAIDHLAAMKALAR